MGFEDDLTEVIRHSKMSEMVLEKYSEDTVKDYLRDEIFSKYKRDWVRQRLADDIEGVYELSDSDWTPDLPDDDQNNSTVVRRYLNIPQFNSLLESGLWFNRIDNFSDDFEGMVSGHTLRRRSETDHYLNSEDDPPLVTRKSLAATKDELIRKQSYASCWRFGGEESAVFWDAYIRDGNGVAIETSLDNLVSITESSDREVMVGKVEYEEEYKGGTKSFAEDHVARVFHKRFAFDDERELRLLTRQSINNIDIEMVGGYTNNTINAKIEADTGIQLELDIDTLIDKILLSPNMNKRTIELLLKLVNCHNLDVEVWRSYLDVDPKSTSPVRATGKEKGQPTDKVMENDRRIK